MAKALHLICRGRMGVSAVPGHAGQWLSRSWQLPTDVLPDAVGAVLFLHEAKAEPSYFGGVVLAVTPDDEPIASDEGGTRYVIRFAYHPSARGQRWQGASHGMAWCSGLVEMGVGAEG